MYVRFPLRKTRRQRTSAARYVTLLISFLTYCTLLQSVLCLIRQLVAYNRDEHCFAFCQLTVYVFVY